MEKIKPNSETTPEITVFCMTYLLHLRFIRADPDLGSNRRRPEPRSGSALMKRKCKRYVIQNTVISGVVSLFGFISIYPYCKTNTSVTKTSVKDLCFITN